MAVILVFYFLSLFCSIVFFEAPTCQASWLTEFQDGGRPRIVPLDSNGDGDFPVKNGGGPWPVFGAGRVSCGVVLFQKVWPY